MCTYFHENHGHIPVYLKIQTWEQGKCLLVFGNYFQMHIHTCYDVVRWRVKGFPFYDNDTLWACILQINCIGHYGVMTNVLILPPKLLSVVSNWNFGCAGLQGF